MKKIIAFVLVFVMFMTTATECFAATEANSLGKTGQTRGMTWMSSSSPLVGSSSQYTTYVGSDNRDLYLFNSLYTLSVAYLTNLILGPIKAGGVVVGATLTASGASWARTIIALASANAMSWGKTQYLYCHEERYGLNSNPNNNIKVVQTWYANSSHSGAPILTSTYYISFL